MTIAVVAIALLGGVFKFAGAKPAPALKLVTVDFAYYNPGSLVLKKFGWLEAAFKQQGTEVKWVHSAGSNRALEYLNGNSSIEYLNGGSVQFGSTAGLSAVLAKANGSPIKAVYVYSRPEWTALVVGRDSNIKSVEDLRGKKIAATKGTDPYLFLMRALQKFGVKKSEVEIVNLQHADGRLALEQERVDAWAGLDPHMAASELNAGSRLIYRNVAFNTYGFLNVTETFAREHPEAVKTVIENYERARKWILAHPEQAAYVLAEEARISIDVARRQLQRTDFSNPVIGQEHIAALNEASPILMDEHLVKPGTDVKKVITDLIDPTFVHAVVK
ncbi:MAG: aliphatic sulfonate ABC transporter substrate-binding protein [Gallionella sp.]